MSNEEILNRVEGWITVIGEKLQVPAQQLMEAAIRYYTAEALGVIALSIAFILIGAVMFLYGFFTWDKKEPHPSEKSGLSMCTGGIVFFLAIVIGGVEIAKVFPKLLAPEWAIVKDIMKD